MNPSVIDARPRRAQPAALNDRELLSIPQTARRMRVSKSTLHKLIASKQIPVIEIGGSRRCLRVDPAALEEWLAAHTTGAARTEAPDAA